MPRLLQYRVEHREPFLVYPLIVNNVRTSYRLQRAGQCPREWGEVTNDMNDWTAHKSFKWVFNIHRATLATLAAGKPLTERWSLPTEQFTTFDQGHISTNVITIFGSDLVACANMPAGYGCRAGVPDDEESFFSLWRPRQLNRQNARVGDSVFVHFAYNTQTDFMDHTGMLAEYAQFVAPMPFRVNQVAPPDTASVPHHPKGQRTPPPRRSPVICIRRAWSRRPSHHGALIFLLVSLGPGRDATPARVRATPAAIRRRSCESIPSFL